MGLLSLPAQAVIITVDGVDYDVVYFTNGYDVPQPSFNENLAILTDPATAPWWGVPIDGIGGAMDAVDFAAAYNAQVGGGPDVSTVVGDEIHFGFAFGCCGSINTIRVVETGFESGTSRVSATNYDFVVYAYTVPIPAAVPEIDGNALAKALFILFALGAWLHTRRARAA